jgi:hypothetical protein
MSAQKPASAQALCDAPAAWFDIERRSEAGAVLAIGHETLFQSTPDDHRRGLEVDRPGDRARPR